MPNKLVLIISAIAIFDLSLIGILSWIKSKKTPYYFWLGWMFIATAIAILDNTHIFVGKGTIILYHIALFFNLAWGAYLISFVKCLRHPNNSSIKINWTLFIPAFLYFPFFILTLIQPHWANDTIRLAEEGKMTPFGVYYNLSICVYTIFSNAFLLWQEYYRDMKLEISNFQHKLIKEVLWTMLVLQLFAFVPFIFKFDIKYVILYMPVFGQIFFLYIFIKMTFSPNAAFNHEAHSEKYLENGTKYSTIKLNEQSAEVILEKIHELMETQKPFLDFDYTLSHMAKDLKVSPNILSMILNSKLNNSFPDFINSFRIKMAIQLLEKANKKNLTIEAIAYDSGFNNRTSFYNAFKKQTGKLPREYLKNENEKEYEQKEVV